MKFPFEKPLVIAHRGARSLAPENTILAAEKGFQTGADLWELDVAMSKDGVVVVNHDDSIERTSNVREIYPEREPWGVDLFDLSELKSLDFGSWYIRDDPFHQIEQGNVSQADLQMFQNLRIATLEEALIFTQDNDWKVNIEIKDITGLTGDENIVEEVVRLIRQHQMSSRVIISSFNHSYIQRVKRVDPQIRTAALVPSPVQDPINLLKTLDAKAYNPGIYHMTDSDFAEIRSIREAGFDVYVWTVNDIDTMKKLIDAGASGIFTDFPQILVEVLSKYEM